MTDVPGDQNMVESKLYLTGSSLMGIFADKYIKKHNGIADDFFYNSFLRGGLTFTDAFKLIDDKKKGLVPAYILPLSVQKKKHDESGDCIEYFLADDESEEKKDKDGMKNKFQSVGGFGSINDGFIKTVEVKSGISFHGAINNGKSDNDIFNYEWIAPFQTFISYALGSEDYLKTFLRFLKESADTAYDYDGEIFLNAYIGRSRTAEYGKIDMIISDIEDISFKSNNDEELDDLCIMTLLSDAIIYNEYGFSTADVNDLAKCLGTSVKIKKSAIRKKTVENFIGKWSARKPMENVITAGSSFLIERSSLSENYKDFEIYGIGERTNEGFGRVAFNLNVKRQLKKEEATEPNLSYLNKIPPLTNISKKIIERRIIVFIKDQLAIEAIKKANEADSRIITGSLSSKLKNFTKAIKKIKDFEHFQKNINALRKVAKDKLSEASIENISMLDFLNKFGYENDKKLFIENKINEIMQKFGIKEFLRKINAENADKSNNSTVLNESTFMADENLTEFQKVYLINLFTQLKRKNKRRQDEKK
jgi:CRISPR-associated protein Csx10